MSTTMHLSDAVNNSRHIDAIMECEAREDESPFPTEPPNSPKTEHERSEYEPSSPVVIVRKFSGDKLPPLPPLEGDVNNNNNAVNNKVIMAAVGDGVELQTTAADSTLLRQQQQQQTKKQESSLIDEDEVILWETVEGCIYPTYWKITDTSIQVDNLETFCLGMCCTYTSDTTMLSSVSDVKIKQTFWGRLFGDKGRIEIYTHGSGGSTVNLLDQDQNVVVNSEPARPKLVIETGDARKLYRILQIQLAKICRDKFLNNKQLF
eukprot:TRINITY_DN10389_c0_g1_i1.p1 TRINITY_DN10389_c0_g1~~TRINITY_DN10389_c0_g1_i1.p1  ORF type:complete len:276 (-),score=76.45 TRINITY_DN10389_c0_g1_i1:20-808(-)